MWRKKMVWQWRIGWIILLPTSSAKIMPKIILHGNLNNSVLKHALKLTKMAYAKYWIYDFVIHFYTPDLVKGLEDVEIWQMLKQKQQIVVDAFFFCKILTIYQ